MMVYVALVLTLLFSTDASCGNGAASCELGQKQQQDETSLLQVVQLVKPGGERQEDRRPPEAAAEKMDRLHSESSEVASKSGDTDISNATTPQVSTQTFMKELEEVSRPVLQAEVASKPSGAKSSESKIPDLPAHLVVDNKEQPELTEGADEDETAAKVKNPLDWAVAGALNRHGNAEWSQYHAQRKYAQHMSEAQSQYAQDAAYAGHHAQVEQAIAQSNYGPRPQGYNYGGAVGVYAPAYGQFPVAGGYGPSTIYGTSVYVPGGFQPMWAERSSESESCWDLCAKADVHKELCHWMCRSNRSDPSKTDPSKASAEKVKEDAAEIDEHRSAKDGAKEELNELA